MRFNLVARGVADWSVNPAGVKWLTLAGAGQRSVARQREGTPVLQNGGIKAPSKSCGYSNVCFYAYRYPLPLACVSLGFILTGKFLSCFYSLFSSFLSRSLPCLYFPPSEFIFPLCSLHYLHYTMKNASFASLVLHSLSNTQSHESWRKVSLHLIQRKQMWGGSCWRLIRTHQRKLLKEKWEEEEKKEGKKKRMNKMKEKRK